MVDRQKVIALLMPHEVDVPYRKMGFRPTCYFDSRGFLTIGIGCNLDAAGAAALCASVGLDYVALRAGQAITLEQAHALLAEGIQSAQDVATMTVTGFMDMPENVQLVVIDMLFNMGSRKFSEFHRMIAALEAHDWRLAANEMRASLWYGQVGTRATNDIDLVLSAVVAV